MGFKEFVAAFLASSVCAVAIVATPRAFGAELPDMIRTEEQGTIRLRMAEPCSDPVLLKMATDDGAPANVVGAGIAEPKDPSMPPLHFCWAALTLNGVQAVMLFTQNGMFPVPAEMFRPASDV